MKNMFALGAFAFVSACALNYAPMRGDVPSYPPNLIEAENRPEVPTVSKPVISIDQELNKPLDYKGAGIGGEVAESFLKTAKIAFEGSDYELIEKAANEAINARPVGEAVTWDNRQSGRSGHVKVLKSLNKDGRYCRQFESEVKMSGGSVVMDNFACKDKSDNWFLLDK